MKSLYIIRGKVRSGKKRGRDLGFPTANVALHKHIPSGIYLSLVKLEKQFLPALTFIGEAKTFEETLYQSETYLLDFTKDIYNEWITIHLLEKMRENTKFVSAEKLIIEMKEDEKKARAYFKK